MSICYSQTTYYLCIYLFYYLFIWERESTCKEGGREKPEATELIYLLAANALLFHYIFKVRSLCVIKFMEFCWILMDDSWLLPKSWINLMYALIYTKCHAFYYTIHLVNNIYLATYCIALLIIKGNIIFASYFHY